MSEARNDATRYFSAAGASGFRLERTADGGFRITGGGFPIDAIPIPKGWRVESGEGESRGVRILEATAADGFVLSEEGEAPAAERGWSSRLSRRSAGSAPAFVLAPDGRLFRVLFHGGPEPHVELADGRVPGAYLVARAAEDGFEIARTPAGCLLELDDEVLILFAAEILASAEEP